MFATRNFMLTTTLEFAGKPTYIPFQDSEYISLSFIRTITHRETGRHSVWEGGVQTKQVPAWHQGIRFQMGGKIQTLEQNNGSLSKLHKNDINKLWLTQYVSQGWDGEWAKARGAESQCICREWCLWQLQGLCIVTIGRGKEGKRFVVLIREMWASSRYICHLSVQSTQDHIYIQEQNISL